MLCRYKVDITASPVPDDQLVKIVSQPQVSDCGMVYEYCVVYTIDICNCMKRIARVQVAKLKTRWEKQQEVYDVSAISYTISVSRLPLTLTIPSVHPAG